MTDNPYQSPLSLELADRELPERDPADRHGRGPLVMTVVGLLMGCTAIGLAGALGAALLGFTYAQFKSHSLEDGAGLAIVGGFIGAFFGACGGGVEGAIAGLWAGLAREQIRRRFVWVLAIVAAIYGSAVGMLGGAMVSMGNFHSNGDKTAWVIIGAVIGAATGLGGGWLLGRFTALFCWGAEMKNAGQC